MALQMQESLLGNSDGLQRTISPNINFNHKKTLPFEERFFMVILLYNLPAGCQCFRTTHDFENLGCDGRLTGPVVS
jgi:hypothetical protein